MTAWAAGTLGFLLGIAATVVLVRRSLARNARAPQEAPRIASVPEPAEPKPEAEIAPPHLITLIGQSLREPLRELRRSGAAPGAVARLEQLTWQIRMLVARPRPMQSLPASPLALLQEAAEQVPLLSEGKVGASWSILNRQPAHVDPERMRAVFRELLAYGATIAGAGGRVGIKILKGDEAGYPVQIEIEIGRRGTEIDPLVLIVSRHIVENQGGQLEIDGNVTRIRLRHSAPEELEDLPEALEEEDVEVA